MHTLTTGIYIYIYIHEICLYSFQLQLLSKDKKIDALTQKMVLLEENKHKNKLKMTTLEIKSSDSHELKKRLQKLKKSSTVIENEIEHRNKCNICVSNPKTHVITPCGHQICGVCGYKIMYEVKKCPTCKTEMLSLIEKK